MTTLFADSKSSPGNVQPGKVDQVKLPGLTGLRGIAALTVALAHYTNSSNLFDGLLVGAGQTGVMLFFIISSFLMFYLYFRETDENLRGRWRDASVFIRNRFARIYPLLLVVATVSLGLSMFSPSLDHYNSGRLWNYMGNVLIFNAKGIGWTISVEFAFYCAFAILLLLPRRFALFLAVLLSLFIVVTFETQDSTYLVEVMNIRLMLFGQAFTYKYFTVGFIVFFFHRYVFLKMPFNLRGMDAALSVILLLLCVFCFPSVYHQLTGDTLSRSGWSDLFVAVILGSLVLGSARLKTLASILSLKPLQFLGKVSYSFYLLHILVLVSFDSLGWSRPNLFNLLIYLFIVSTLSYLSYLAVERPARQWLRSH